MLKEDILHSSDMELFSLAWPVELFTWRSLIHWAQILALMLYEESFADEVRS